MADEHMNLTTEERMVFSRLAGRRAFMGATAGATLAALVGHEPRRVLAQGSRPSATADAVIVLWMAGGMAQTETWDPKRYTPFEPGVRTERVLSTFPSIDTAVDHIKISQGLERVARVMDRGAIIRTFQAPDLGYILHSRHQYHWHTGYVPPQTVAMPHIGSIVSRTLGPKNPTVPAFISIGQNMEIGAESAAVKAFHTAGFLGSDHGPFLITNPQDAATAVRPPAGLGDRRFLSRRQLYEKLLAKEPVYEYAGDFQREVAHPVARIRRSPADLSVGESVRSVARAAAGVRHVQHRPIWSGVSPGAASGRSRCALHRGDDRIHPISLLGHARAWARAREG